MFDPEVLPDHEDYKAEGLDSLYRHEREHPWFIHRLNVILRAFSKHASPEDSIMEIGAGTGHTARALMEAGYRHLALGEIHLNGLRYARQYGLKNLYQFDLRTPPFREHFDVVALFDVLEHIADDERTVRGIHQMLREGGRIILSVPAHRWLWSRIDELSNHYRRYDRASLGTMLEECGFEILESRYFFTALVPGLLLRSAVSRDVAWDGIESACGLQLSKAGTIALRLACGPGDFLLAPLRRFVGGSLIAVARKR